jgi:hypothetical protein
MPFQKGNKLAGSRKGQAGVSCAENARGEVAGVSAEH